MPILDEMPSTIALAIAVARVEEKIDALTANISQSSEQQTAANARIASDLASSNARIASDLASSNARIAADLEKRNDVILHINARVTRLEAWRMYAIGLVTSAAAIATVAGNYFLKGL